MFEYQKILKVHILYTYEVNIYTFTLSQAINSQVRLAKIMTMDILWQHPGYSVFTE